MSAQGGRQGIEDFGKALKDAVDDIRLLALGAGRAGRGLAELTGATFAANTAMLAVQRGIRDVAFGTIEDTLRFGSGEAGRAFAANGLRAAAALPFDPLQAGVLQRPIEQAGNRLAGILGPWARAGGEATDEQAEEAYRYLLRQEKMGERASGQAKRIQNKVAAEEIDKAGGGNGAFMGLPTNPAAYFMRMFGMTGR